MRALVLSVTAGYGHISTANAVADEFKARGVEVVVEDLYHEISHLAYDLIDKGYLFTINHFQYGWKRAYERMEGNEHVRRLTAAFTSNKLIVKRLARHLEGHMPDVIICTHPFAGQVLNELKEIGIIKTPCIGIITDYCIHPGWEDCGALEYIVTASELLSYIAQKKSIAISQIAPLGIPVRPVFRKKDG